MKAPYRSEIDALRERKETLQAEIAKLSAQTKELDGLRARQAEIEKELASIEGRLGRRALPLLDQVRVASPCSASWDEMLGDDRSRFCLSCDKSVYNISAMPRAEAEAFLRERVGQKVCIRYYQRADGTILTEDCPVGVTKKRRKKLALAAFGAGAMALAGASMLAKTTCAKQGEMSTVPVAGSVAIPDPEPPERLEPLEGVQGQMRMGDWEGPAKDPPKGRR